MFLQISKIDFREQLLDQVVGVSKSHCKHHKVNFVSIRLYKTKCSYRVKYILAAILRHDVLYYIFEEVTVHETSNQLYKQDMVSIVGSTKYKDKGKPIEIGASLQC